MSTTIQTKQLKHIAVSNETYKRIQNEGRYGDTMDSIVSRILLAHEQRKKGELVIS
jgi:hypothetical protein